MKEPQTPEEREARNKYLNNNWNLYKEIIKIGIGTIIIILLKIT